MTESDATWIAGKVPRSALRGLIGGCANPFGGTGWLWYGFGAGPYAGAGGDGEGCGVGGAIGANGFVPGALPGAGGGGRVEGRGGWSTGVIG
ncbi:MAG: hypothetical protein KF837_08120 [Labilithrix sp.]|nr:hypothetical protein [Labilithrix sp.]